MGRNSVDILGTGYRQFLCANSLPFAIAIREDICEQRLALAMFGRLDHGAIHNSCLTVNPYMQICEMLLGTLGTGCGMLAQKLKVLVLGDDCPRHHVQKIRSKNTFESHGIVLHL